MHWKNPKEEVFLNTLHISEHGGFKREVRGEQPPKILISRNIGKKIVKSVKFELPFEEWKKKDSHNFKLQPRVEVTTF